MAAVKGPWQQHAPCKRQAGAPYKVALLEESEAQRGQRVTAGTADLLHPAMPNHPLHLSLARPNA